MAHGRYDLTDFEWKTIQPLLPNKPRGVPRVDDRKVLNGIFFILRSGMPWADLPEGYGPYMTIYNRFNRWRKAGVWDRQMDAIIAAHEALVHSWVRHDRTVMMPDNGFLMCYGLVPRLLDRERIVWDDASKPVYDVVEVKPLSVYEMPDSYPHAFVRVRRDYLEDYSSLKGCAIVAVYYEMRYSRGDQAIAAALGTDESREFKLPGRLLDIRKVKPANRRGEDQLTQVWGCRLILKPTGRPISEEKKDRDLVWPGGKTFRDFGPLEHIFVRDEVLQEWETRDEFSVSPNSGDVSYGGWWSTDRSLRLGRHHIRTELRKLYEGTPPYVIRHFYRFA